MLTLMNFKILFVKCTPKIFDFLIEKGGRERGDGEERGGKESFGAYILFL